MKPFIIFIFGFLLLTSCEESNNSTSKSPDSVGKRTIKALPADQVCPPGSEVPLEASSQMEELATPNFFETGEYQFLGADFYGFVNDQEFDNTVHVKWELNANGNNTFTLRLLCGFARNTNQVVKRSLQIPMGFIKKDGVLPQSAKGEFFIGSESTQIQTGQNVIQSNFVFDLTDILYASSDFRMYRQPNTSFYEIRLKKESLNQYGFSAVLYYQKKSL